MSEIIYLKVLVPSIAAGAIIGKGGDAIAKIQNETGAKVKLSKLNDFYPGTTERVCLIQGTINEVRKLHEYIMHRLLEKPELNFVNRANSPPAQNNGMDQVASSTHSGTQADSPGSGLSLSPEWISVFGMSISGQASVNRLLWERHKQVKILVPNCTAGLVIGKLGSYVTEIKDKTGAFIQISQKSKDINLPERCITIAGEPDQLKAAVDLVLAKIAEDPQSGTCQNISYSHVQGPVASAFPTGSPFAFNPLSNLNPKYLPSPSNLIRNQFTFQSAFAAAIAEYQQQQQYICDQMKSFHVPTVGLSSFVHASASPSSPSNDERMNMYQSFRPPAANIASNNIAYAQPHPLLSYNSPNQLLFQADANTMRVTDTPIMYNQTGRQYAYYQQPNASSYTCDSSPICGLYLDNTESPVVSCPQGQTFYAPQHQLYQRNETPTSPLLDEVLRPRIFHRSNHPRQLSSDANLIPATPSTASFYSREGRVEGLRENLRHNGYPDRSVNEICAALATLSVHGFLNFGSSIENELSNLLPQTVAMQNLCCSNVSTNNVTPIDSQQHAHRQPTNYQPDLIVDSSIPQTSHIDVTQLSTSVSPPTTNQ